MPLDPQQVARRRQLILAVTIPTVFLAVILIVALANDNDSNSTSTPPPISRDQLVTEYFDLVPDPNATPDDVVDLATQTCERLNDGVTPTSLTDSLADTYHGAATARRVLHLLASYGCPQHAGDI